MENLRYWAEFHELEQRLVILSFASVLKTKKIDTLTHLFELGNPLIYSGEKNNKPYWRLTTESKTVMALLITNYLNK